MVILRQIKISCPTCGEYLFRVFRATYDVDKLVNETSEYTPLCQKCNPKEYLEALKNAGKIELVDSEKRIYEGVEKEGEKVAHMTGRKHVESEGVE